MNVFPFWQTIFQQLHRYYLIDICGARMCSSRRWDVNFLCEEFDEEFNKTTDDRNVLDLEDDRAGWNTFQVIGLVRRAAKLFGKPKPAPWKKGEKLKVSLNSW